eukprot:2680541-Pyramimonas_sp.AAC.1
MRPGARARQRLGTFDSERGLPLRKQRSSRRRRQRTSPRLRRRRRSGRDAARSPGGWSSKGQ